jgi:DNA-binding transcriptional LysR family regulator
LVAVSLLLRGVLFRDVWRVADDSVVALAQDGFDFAAVLEPEKLVAPRDVVHRDLLGEANLRVRLCPEPMQQAVGDDDVGANVGCAIQSFDADRLQRVQHGQHQPKARDGHRVRIDVDAIDLIEGAARQIGDVFGGGLGLPAV